MKLRSRLIKTHELYGGKPCNKSNLDGINTNTEKTECNTELCPPGMICIPKLISTSVNKININFSIRSTSPNRHFFYLKWTVHGEVGKNGRHAAKLVGVE